jgi:DNA-binding XRE family transcriptional regulator
MGRFNARHQMTDTTFLADDLIALRRDLGLTQQEMAAQLDMALRSYQAIETGESAYRHIHRLAVERTALTIAADKKAPMLAPAAVRKDAIELVRVGQATGKPEFLGSKTDAPGQQAEPVTTERFRAAYSVVGELVLLTTALDHQLNHVLIQVLHLADSPMLEAVVATLDMNRKIEMLKARAKHISNAAWQKPLQTHLDKLEQVSSWRNIACHTALIPDKEHGAVFAPAAAAKLLKNLQLGENPTSKQIPIAEFTPKIKLGESALFEGQVLIQNFERMNAERLKRFTNNATLSK